MDDRPHLLIVQDSLPRRHAGREDAVLDDRLELAVRVRLDLVRDQQWDRRGHAVRERDPGVLAVESMTGDAVPREEIEPLRDGCLGRGERVPVAPAADRDVPLDSGGEGPLKAAGWSGLAAREHQEQDGRESSQRAAHSITIVMCMLPCPSPQK